VGGYFCVLECSSLHPGTLLSVLAANSAGMPITKECMGLADFDSLQIISRYFVWISGCIDQVEVKVASDAKVSLR
jgi:hypothetical protein